jgi:predicted permease
VLLFAGVCAVGAGLLAGLAPIASAGRSDFPPALGAAARDGHGRRSGMRNALLILQAALSTVLLVGAGLFVRSVRNAQTLHLGYDAERLVWIEPHLRGTTLDSAASAALQAALLERALANPAVQNASLVTTVPFSSTWFTDIVADGSDSARHVNDVIIQIASPGYFATTGTRVTRGRAFSEVDRAGAPLAVIVSDSLAHAAWPNSNPIGRCLKLTADTTPCRTVVGVAEDVRSASLATSQSPMFYVPAAQDGDNRQANLFVRVRGSGAREAESLRRDLQHVMPGAGYIVARPLSSILSVQTRSWRLGATMFTAFGVLALVLASIGLYSVVAYTVAQRTHEIGVRIALGARTGDVVRLIVREGVRAVSVGVALGLLVALGGSRWLAPLLFHVSPTDPLVFAGVGGVLVAVAIFASWLPARRATALDPSTALRAG